MKIYIEAVIFIVILFVLLYWQIWRKLSTRRALKKYKPEDDKSKKGGEYFGDIAARERSPKIPTVSATRHSEPEGRELLQTTTTSSVREDSSKPRKSSSRLRKLLKRRRN